MATFGVTDPTSYSTTLNAAVDGERVSKFTLSEAGTVSKVSFYMSSGANTGQSFKALIYADSAGAPASLLGTGGSVTVPSSSSAQWFDSSLSLALAAGDYWIGFVAGTATSNGQYYNNPSTSNTLYVKNGAGQFAAPADPFGSPSSTVVGYEMAVNATYTASATASSKQIKFASPTRYHMLRRR